MTDVNSIGISIGIAAKQYQLAFGQWPGCVLLGPDQFEKLAEEMKLAGNQNARAIINRDGLHCFEYLQIILTVSASMGLRTGLFLLIPSL